MRHNKVSSACAGIMLMGILSGCKEQKAVIPVNTLTFDTRAFESLRLDYDADDIYVLESENDKIIVREYMNKDKKSYYARCTVQNGELLITEGDRPRFFDFKSYIEVYLPQNYDRSLSLHSTSGTINSEIPLHLSEDFIVDTTSGTVRLSNTKALKIKASCTNGSLSFENIEADEIMIRTTNSATMMNQINGVISYQSKGGELTASGLCGSGSFQVSGEGTVDLSYDDVSGDLYAYSKNGAIAIAIPNELAFKFSAVTREGTIETSFADLLAVTDDTAAGTVGTFPVITIELETRNGDIKVIKNNRNRQ
ncbi:MAG: DUF4097 family beta strand repeat-containing protein [Lachnospiraceae bacterium]